MAELTKQALRVENNTEFPNNNNGAITPSNLRGFNLDMIDSTVNQAQYTTDSGSWNQQIDALEQFTASASGLNTGSLLITASAVSNVITFTKGNGSTFNVTVADTTDLTPLNTFTASAAISITNLNASSASQQVSINNLNTTTASLLVETQNLELFSASALVSISNLNASSASQQISINALNVSSASQQVSIDSLNSKTGSYATTGSNIFVGANTFTSISASSFVSASEFIGNGSKITGITASIALPILDEGIPQGNAFSMNFTGSAISAIVVGGTAVVSVNVPDTGSFNSLTASFNAYTSSNNQRVSSLEAATSSYATSAITASSIITASVTNDDITFTKGDGSQFTIQVATGSFALSSSFAETASIARNLEIIARNGNASTLGVGTVVHITGASGDNPIFNTASFDTELLSANTLGLLRYSSVSGADVQVIVNGIVVGVNTDPALGYAEGDVLYLSSSGQFTRVQPQAPNQIVVLGQVLRAQQNNGSIYVSINNGWELNELHNVQINGVQTGDLLQYESSSYGLWKNKSIAGAGITTTSSFNSYTSSTDGRLTNIESTTASFNTSVTNLNSATASLFTSASLALVTASFSGNTLTFTKGDATTFGVVIPDVSGSTINTGSFATTGSNNFVGDQIITGSLILSSSNAVELNVMGNSVFTGSTSITGALSITPLNAPNTFPAGGTAQFIIPFLSGSTNTFVRDTDNALFFSPAFNQLGVSSSAANTSITPGSMGLTNSSGNNSTLNATRVSNRPVAGKLIGISGDPSLASLFGATTTNPAIVLESGSAAGGEYYTPIEFQSSQSFSDGRVTFTRNVAILENLEVTGSLTASLQQGYVWVGDAAGRTTTVATSSFGGGGTTNTGSLLVTASFVNDVNIRFTKGDNTTFDIAGIVSTGSSEIYGTLTFNEDVNAGISFPMSGSATVRMQKQVGVNNLIWVDENNEKLLTLNLDTDAFSVSGGFEAGLQQGYAWVGQSNGRSAAVPTSSFASNINTGSFAITGSNTFRGNQTITGSVFISSTGGLGLSNTDGATAQYFGNSFGSNVGIYKVSDATEIGLALDGAAWTTNWANGPLLYVNNTTGDTYEGVFGFQNKTNYTDGRITALKPLDVRGNTTITGSLILSSSAATELFVIGNAVITGSLILSSSAATELQVIGNSVFTGSVAGNVVSASITSNTASIDFNLANYFEVTSSVTPLHLNVTNITPGRTSTLIISASASSSITFSPNVAQPSGSAYSGSLGSIDILSLIAFNSSKVNLVATKALI